MRYLALLRGINLGSRNRVVMGELREMFAAMGHGDVATHLQTGNVLFTASGPAAPLAADIERRLASELGVTVTVLLRSKSELGKVVARNPLAADVADPSKLHVTFLADSPDRGRDEKLAALCAPDEAYAVLGREVYLHCPNGYGRTKLSNANLEKRLGVPATTRSWKVVNTLNGLMGA